MEKIPVGKSIAGAYGFFFGRFLTILGLSWLPASLLAVARYHFVANAGAGFVPAHLCALAYFLIALLLVSSIAVSLSREALGLRDERMFAHLIIGARELRLFFSLLVADILLGILAAVLLLGVCALALYAKDPVAALIAGTPLASYPVLHILVCVSGVLALLAEIYAALRLTFLLTPITAAEGKASLSRAWELSAGNFWRMFVIFIFIAVPVTMALMIAEYILLGAQFTGIAHQMMADGLHPGAPFFQLMQTHAVGLAAIAASAVTLATALSAGASAAAYRSFVPLPEPPEQLEPYAEPAPVPPAMPMMHHDVPVDHGHDNSHGPVESHDEDHGDVVQDARHDAPAPDHADHGHREAPATDAGNEGPHDHAEEHGHKEEPASGDDLGRKEERTDDHAHDHEPEAARDDTHGDGHANDDGHAKHDDHGDAGKDDHH